LSSPSVMRHGYSAVPTHENGANGGGKSKKAKAFHRDTPPVPEAFNVFDPADLPPRLAEYANMVFSACEDLGNFFGFQDSSVRNQAEHLLILLSNNRRYMSSHILPPSLQPPSPIHALHAKVFSNYVKWCRAMGVPPHFSKMNTSMSAPPAVASRVVDLVLYFCIWGEACNLRHMAECVWFLYHKMMEEYIKSEGYTQTRSLYAGHFLDNVVEPIYCILLKVGHSCCSDYVRSSDSGTLIYMRCLVLHCLYCFAVHAIQVRPFREEKLRRFQRILLVKELFEVSIFE
jgi:callose synthase